ncbi:MAG: type III pantothenate kinase [Chitinophagales bacterium]
MAQKIILTPVQTDDNPESFYFCSVHLIIDLGNTAHKVAFGEGNQIQSVHQFSQLDLPILNALLQKQPIENWILSSVTHPIPDIENELKNNYPGIIFNHQTPLPIHNAYKTPETLGKDRLANVVAAHYLFPEQDALVNDAGSCIKYDFISSKGNYCGGSISPGLQMRFMAMHHFTARLPLIDMDSVFNGGTPPPVAGDSTPTAMISGGAMGALLEMEGFISHYRKVYSDVTIILTGGNMAFFDVHLKSRIFAIPNLTLTGLLAVLEYNSRDI